MSVRHLIRRSAIAFGMVLVTGLAAASPAAAHPHHDTRMEGWLDGVLHPILGLDHLAAMVAAGAIVGFALRRFEGFSGRGTPGVRRRATGGPTGWARR